jgi:hypothetical protein
MWGDDNGDQYPATVPNANGGAESYLYSASNPTLTATPAVGGPVYCPAAAFVVMSNIVDNPALLACPSDSTQSHTSATNWTQFYYPLNSTTPDPNPDNAAYSSYFVGGDAIDTQPQSLLAGDRNIGNGGSPVGQPAGNYWGGGAPSGTGYNPGQSTSLTASQGLGTAGGQGNKGVDFLLWSWSANDLHLGAGNLLLGDGSAQQATIHDLQTDLLNATNGATMYPFYNFP